MLIVRHAEPMFLLHCTACGQRELRGAHGLTSFSNTVHGIEYAMDCTRCGATVRMITGARVASTVLDAAEPTAPAAA